MASKWMKLAPWNHGSPPSDSPHPPAVKVHTDKEEAMSQDLNPKSASAAREVPEFQLELAPMDDVYRAASIMAARKGYSVAKVVEMLDSPHLRDLSAEARRAAVLMALDAAGISIDQVQRDAKARQEALDAYEAEQKKFAESNWARKAEEVAQIKAELDSIKAHYTARIERAEDGVAREKAAFAAWQETKQQELKKMSDALDLCVKKPEPVSSAAAPPAALAATAGAGKD